MAQNLPLQQRLLPRRNLAILLPIFIAYAAGCAGNTSPSETVRLDKLLPAVGQLDERATSELTSLTLNGIDTEVRSDGAEAQGNSLLLSAGAGNTEFALYRFGNPGALDSVEVLMDAGQTEEAWIGVADFAAGVWEFAGPFTGTETLTLDPVANLSPAGNFWLAIVAPPGRDVLIDSLTLFVTNQAPLAAIETANPKANPNDTIVLDAVGSTDVDGAIVDFEWDLDGDGVFNVSPAEQAANGASFASVALGANPGQFTASVRVTDDGGAQDSAGILLTILGWRTLVVDPATGTGLDTSLAVIDGHPAIAYRLRVDTSIAILRFARSSTVTGQNSADWSIVDVAAHGSVGNLCLAEINGKPAISYKPGSEGLKYAHSLLADGSAAWSSVLVDNSSAIIGSINSLAEVGGRPAISYWDATNNKVKYAFSSAADGGSGWNSLFLPGFTSGPYTSLAAINGLPVIACVADGQAAFFFSDAPETAAGWSATALTAGGFDDERISLEVVAGKPGISYHFAQQLLYARSSDADGRNGNSWANQGVDNGGPGGFIVGEYSSLAEVGGFPAISYYDSTNEDLRYAVSSLPSGDTGSWTLTTVDSAGNVGAHTSLAALADGRPAISYDDTSANVMKYAVLFD